MRIAFVLGFFDPVLKELKSQFPRELRLRSLIWIRQTKIGGPPDLTDFSSQLFDRLTQGATHILLIVAVLSGKEWIEERLRSMVAEARERFSGSVVEIIFEKKAMASELIIPRLREFECTIPQEVTRELLARKLGGSKILCVREKSSTSFRRALERHGISEELFEEFFVEHSVQADSSKEGLQKKVHSFKYVFYAFYGFGHPFGGFLDEFRGTLFKESLAVGCAMSFKKWLLEE